MLYGSPCLRPEELLEKAQYRLSAIDLQRGSADESGRLATHEGNDLPEIRRVTREQAAGDTAYCLEPVRRVISGTRQIERDAVLPQILRGGLRPCPQPRACRVAQRERGNRLFTADDVIRQIRPHRPATMRGTAALTSRTIARRLSLSARAIAASSASSAHRGWPPAIAHEYVDAAEATDGRLDQVVRSTSVGDIGHDRVSGAACRRDFPCRAFECIPAPSADDDVHALSGKREGAGPPQALRRRRHQSRLAVDSEIHHRPLVPNAFADLLRRHVRNRHHKISFPIEMASDSFLWFSGSRT